MAWAYYNENDPFAAEWLRCLIWQDLIAPGDVDQRSIEDVTADDLRGFTQHHFFAGIGVWSSALRLAGWADDRPVWTGSCPCQPFSDAGGRGGFDDKRHLWPTWAALIQQHRPLHIFGEQVASPAGLGWLDVVSADLEAADYAVAAADLCAAGVGAPHRRQRLYFAGVGGGYRARWGSMVDPKGEQAWLPRRPWEPRSAVADTDGRDGGRRSGEPREGPGADAGGAEELGRRGMPSGAVAHHHGQRQLEHAQQDGEPLAGSDRQAPRRVDAGGCGESGGALANNNGVGCDGRPGLHPATGPGGRVPAEGDGWWDHPDWVACRDGRRRPVEPGTFPLAHGIAGRVGRLRGYGNAIVRPLAATFIASVMDCLE